jgi:hypothetical protein
VERPGKPRLAAVPDTLRTLAHFCFDIVDLFPLRRPPIREQYPSTPVGLCHVAFAQIADIPGGLGERAKSDPKPTFLFELRYGRNAQTPVIR